LFQDIGGHDARAGGRETVRFFEQGKDRIRQMIFRIRLRFLADGQNSGFVDAAQKRADDDLLFVLFDVGELENRAASGREHIF